MDDAKKQLAEKLKAANNILVTVSRNPSVDQLAGCIGLTLLLGKLGKHAVSVFSGEIPSTLEFLEPDKTIEKNTDSLRDFIIALDKNKADKLRYKVEDNVVRIFITPYRTSISQDDFEFSQGDFNVDVIVALGVQEQEDLDQAITAHGRILHDATLTSINTSSEGGFGIINWHDSEASSLSELVTELAQTMKSDILDTQISTALLTGIVAETDRFSNDKTSSRTMTISAALMSAGANQQLVASKLKEPLRPAPIAQSGDNHPDGGAPPASSPPVPDDGLIAIPHVDEFSGNDQSQPPAGPASYDTQTLSDYDPSVFDVPDPEPTSQPANELLMPSTPLPSVANNGLSPGSRMITEPPILGGRLTANSEQEALDPVTDPFSMPGAEPPQMMDRKPAPFASTTPLESELSVIDQSPPLEPTPSEPVPEQVFEPATPPTMPSPPAWTLPPTNPDPPTPPPTPIQSATLLPDSGHTLAELEAEVKNPHKSLENLDDARDEVSRALSVSAADSSVTSEPIQSLGAQPLGVDLHPDNSAPLGPSLEDILSHTEPDTPGAPPAATPQVIDPTAPPPVPPPIPFQFGNPPPAQ